MRQNPSTFNPLQKAGSLLLILALVWLSVSTPYVYRFQQKTKTEKQAMTAENDTDCEDGCGLLNNTNEEKAESGPNTLQEFLHEPLHIAHPSIEQVNEYGHFEQKASVAYHPEFISPPPEA
jgi:hypothetical protein